MTRLPGPRRPGGRQRPRTDRLPLPQAATAGSAQDSDWTPRAAAARRTPTTKDGPTALAPGGNRGVGPRLGHVLGGPSPRRGQPGDRKGILIGGTRIQARRPSRAAPATNQAAGSTASQGLRQGSPGSGRGSPLSQKVHELVTRQWAQACKGGQRSGPITKTPKVDNAYTSEGFLQLPMGNRECWVILT